MHGGLTLAVRSVSHCQPPSHMQTAAALVMGKWLFYLGFRLAHEDHQLQLSRAIALGFPTKKRFTSSKGTSHCGMGNCARIDEIT